MKAFEHGQPFGCPCHPISGVPVVSPGMDSENRKRIKHLDIPNHAHELTFSCYKNYPLLSFDPPRIWLLDALNVARNQLNYAVLAFVIMPDHAHVIVYPRARDYSISLFLKSVKQSVSRKAADWFPAYKPEWQGKLTVYRSDGTKAFKFWQAGGGYDRNITGRRTLERMIEYIHRNPVRKGLVADPHEWKWSNCYARERATGLTLDIDEAPW